MAKFSETQRSGRKTSSIGLWISAVSLGLLILSAFIAAGPYNGLKTGIASFGVILSWILAPIGLVLSIRSLVAARKQFCPVGRAVTGIVLAGFPILFLLYGIVDAIVS